MAASSSDIGASYQKIALFAKIGGTKAANLIGVDVSMGLSQINASATLHFTSRPSGAEEKKPVEVWAGYSSDAGTDMIFKGELSGLSWEYFPGVVSMEARDLLARTRLPWGGEDREYTEQDTAAVIRNLLEAMGIPSSLAHIEGSDWTLGVVQAVVAASGRPFWPIIEEIDRLEGYRTFTDRNGAIQRFRVSGNTGVGQAWTYEEGVNIISIKPRKRTVEGIINRAVVTGLDYEGLTVGGPGVAEFQQDNPFIPDPPRYVTEEIQSDLIEDDDRAIEIAERFVVDNNRRPEVFEFEVVFNPKIQPLSIIKLIAPSVEVTSANLIVDRVQHSIRGSTARTTVTTLGGNVVAVPSNLAPIAAFDAKLFQEGEDQGGGVYVSKIVGIADGGASSDPDGDSAAMTFAWTVTVDAGTVDPSSGSDTVFRFVITGAATLATITLVVTDEGGATATLTREIPISVSTLYVEDKHSAEHGVIASSSNGETTAWNEYAIPGGGATCLSEFAPAWGQIWGAANGHIYGTIDMLKTDAVDLGQPHGAVACTAVFVHELDTTRAWAAFTDGKVYQGVVDPSTPSATWTLRGTIPAGPVEQIREGIAALGSLRATAGAGYYASEDGGAHWTLLHTFDVAWRMAAGFDTNLASGLNDPAPLYAESGTLPTVPGGVEHIRGLTFGWRVQALYATDDTAALYFTDATLAALTAHADSLPAIGNHMMRSGNEDGVIYVAVGDGTDHAGGVIKWLPDAAAPFYLRQTDNRKVYQVSYGAAHIPSAAVDFVFLPMGESDPDKDKWHRYRDGIWTHGPLPESGWKWASIKIHPTNPLRWLILGFPSANFDDRTMPYAQQALFLSEDAGATWTGITLPQPVEVHDSSTLGQPGTATNAKLYSIGWQPERGRWYVSGKEDVFITGRGAWWYGTTATDAVGKRSIIIGELFFSAPGINGTYIFGEGDSPGLGTSGGIWYTETGATGFSSAYPHDPGVGFNCPIGPIDTRPGTEYAFVQADTQTAGILYNPASTSTWPYNEVYGGGGSSVGPGVTGAYVWIGAGQDRVFVASQETGHLGIYALDYDYLTWSTQLAGAPDYAFSVPISLRVGRTQRRVCIGYGRHAGGDADDSFFAFDGAVWGNVAMPYTGMTRLAGVYDVPYDVFETADLV